MVSFFVAKTRAEAHAITRENWHDTDSAAGLEYMKSLGIDPTGPDFATGAVGQLDASHVGASTRARNPVAPMPILAWLWASLPASCQ
jgi:hypothetical protein